MSFNSKEIMTAAEAAALEAGEFLLNKMGDKLSIETKADRNLATDADKEAERIIVDKVRSHFPSHGILAEEGGDQSRGEDYIWIIDPLDGTHNYIRGVNVFGVSIGILFKGEFTAGVIYMPGEKELYTAESGSGAYKNGTKIHISKNSDFKDCSLSYDSTIRHDPDMILGILKELALQVFNVRMTGSSVRLLSHLAEGKFDASVEFCDRAWDFAAGAVLIREAGGIITELSGKPLSSKSTGYLAANPVYYEKILPIVNKYLK